MELPETLLKKLDQSSGKSLNSLELAESLKIEHQKIVGAIKSLESLGNVIEAKSFVNKKWQLTNEGKKAGRETARGTADYNYNVKIYEFFCHSNFL